MAKSFLQPLKGRGATFNPDGRFETLTRHIVDRSDWWVDEEESDTWQTEVYEEHAKSIISHNDSPDVGFGQSINPYRGCEHGCIYCYARPTHAYWNLSPGLDFETKLFAKVNAAELLQKELAHPKYRCAVIALGANTDPYQPVERKLEITRGIIKVLSDADHPVAIITKSARIERDLDLLIPMAKKNLVSVYITVTTLDSEITRTLEPRASAPLRRVQAIQALSESGIPVGVMVAPIIPFLTDSGVESVLEAAAHAGASSAGYTVLRLPYEVKDLFKDWLIKHYPLKADHIMSRLKQMRQGKENDSNFGSRMVGLGQFSQLLAQRFEKACRRFGLNRNDFKLDTGLFSRPNSEKQLNLF